jgi:hypothetical protein
VPSTTQVDLDHSRYDALVSLGGMIANFRSQGLALFHLAPDMERPAQHCAERVRVDRRLSGASRWRALRRRCQLAPL